MSEPRLAALQARLQRLITQWEDRLRIFQKLEEMALQRLRGTGAALSDVWDTIDGETYGDELRILRQHIRAVQAWLSQARSAVGGGAQAMREALNQVRGGSIRVVTEVVRNPGVRTAAGTTVGIGIATTEGSTIIPAAAAAGRTALTWIIRGVVGSFVVVAIGGVIWWWSTRSDHSSTAGLDGSYVPTVTGIGGSCPPGAEAILSAPLVVVASDAAHATILVNGYGGDVAVDGDGAFRGQFSYPAFSRLLTVEGVFAPDGSSKRIADGRLTLPAEGGQQECVLGFTALASTTTEPQSGERQWGFWDVIDSEYYVVADLVQLSELGLTDACQLVPDVPCGDGGPFFLPAADGLAFFQTEEEALRAFCGDILPGTASFDGQSLTGTFQFDGEQHRVIGYPDPTLVARCSA